ncbi:MAG: porin family protein [Flavobacteriaceae bacterium]
MKNKIILTLGLIIAFSTASFAQFGVRAGANFSTLSLNEDFIDTATNSTTGYHVGANLLVGLGPVGVEVGAYWSTTGSEIVVNEGLDVIKNQVNLDYIQVPVALRVNFFPMLYGKVGGYVAGNIKAASELYEISQGGDITEDTLDLADEISKFDGGLVFGLGAKISKLEIEGGFDLGLVNIAEPTADLSELDMSNAVYKVGVTYRF